MNVTPVSNLADPIIHEWDKLSYVVPQHGHASLLNFAKASFRDDEPALKVLRAVDQYEYLAIVESTEYLPRIAGTAGQSHPQDIYRNAEFHDFQARFFTHSRVAPISSNSQVRANLEDSGWGFGSHTVHSPAFHHQIRDLCFHSELKRRIAPGLCCEEVQEVPLRHKCQELTMSR